MGHAEETLLAMQSSLRAICTVASLPHFSRLPCVFIFCRFSISPVLKDNHICSVQFSIFHYNLCLTLAVVSVHLGPFFTFILTTCLWVRKALLSLKILFSLRREVKHGVEGGGGAGDLPRVTRESKQTEIPA